MYIQSVLPFCKCWVLFVEYSVYCIREVVAMVKYAANNTGKKRSWNAIQSSAEVVWRIWNCLCFNSCCLLANFSMIWTCLFPNLVINFQDNYFFRQIFTQLSPISVLPDRRHVNHKMFCNTSKVPSSVTVNQIIRYRGI